jgi:hypothetical protein
VKRVSAGKNKRRQRKSALPGIFQRIFAIPATRFSAQICALMINIMTTRVALFHFVSTPTKIVGFNSKYFCSEASAKYFNSASGKIYSWRIARCNLI